MVYRVFVEKKPGLDNEARALLSDAKNLLGIDRLERVRLLNRYDAENISAELFDYARRTVFSEPQLDITTDEAELEGAEVFAVEYLPGQFDQRADSAAQCIQIISCGDRPLVHSAKVYALYGELTKDDIETVKKYVINPVEAHEASLEKPETLEVKYDIPTSVQTLDGFNSLSAEELAHGANVPLGRAMYLEAALADREEMKLNEPGELRDFVARLDRARETDAEPPAGLRATLRPYQRAGYGWLVAMEAAGFGGILADDMGLGKTVQALAMLLRAKERDGAVRALVVCPASLQLNWQMEAARFAPALRCEVLSGTAAKRRAQIVREDAPELLISSSDQLRRDAQAYEGVTFSHVLLDEAQSIKNAASQGARAAKTLLARSRLALTGTPIENRLSELWSIFDFLMPGYLPPYKRFRERYEMPIVQEGDAGARENLRRLVAPFILRRMKADVLADLPEKVETIVGSELTAEQRRLYAAHAAKLAGELDAPGDGPQRRMQILAGLTRLRQLCCDPRLCLEGYAGGSGKLEQCASLCVQAVDEGHRVLLFSQFTTMLDLLAQRLAQEGLRLFLLTGDTPKEERMRLVERFNAGGVDVFLISLKAGGTGLNLTGADVVIHYDPWWNTAAQNQATDRAYRIGQTRGVQVLRLIASGTIEERIAKLQEEKAALSDGILAGDTPAAPLDERTLRALLG